MPIVVTFDLASPRPHESNRIRGAFERLGWERLGNTAYRYPRLGEQPEAEDWFNCVIPALMLLRAYSRAAAATGRGIVRYTLDAQSSTGCNHGAVSVGTPPSGGAEIDCCPPSRSGSSFGEQQLRDWLDGIEWPYPMGQEGAGP